jgi:hypothetical protein
MFSGEWARLPSCRTAATWAEGTHCSHPIDRRFARAMGLDRRRALAALPADRHALHGYRPTEQGHDGVVTTAKPYNPRAAPPRQRNRRREPEECGSGFSAVPKQRRQCRAVSHVELDTGAVDVALDGAHRHDQPLGDLAVAQTRSHQVGDFAFSRGQG